VVHLPFETKNQQRDVTAKKNQSSSKEHVTAAFWMNEETHIGERSTAEERGESKTLNEKRSW
jgi:hypothetical protein